MQVRYRLNLKHSTGSEKSRKCIVHISAMFRIRIGSLGLNTDPDPAFYIHADPSPWSQTMRIDADCGSRSRADMKSRVQFMYTVGGTKDIMKDWKL
jgi:hypothetical protein